MLNALYAAADSSLTLTELAERSGVSRPTAEEAALAIVAAGLAIETSDEMAGPRPVGRPAKRYAFRADGAFVAGIDIGGHKILAWCADLFGRPRGTHRIDVDPGLPPRQRLDAAREALRRAIRSARVAQRDVVAVGVATTGIVGGDGVVALSADLPGWTGVDLRAELAVIGEAPVVVGNDCNLAALAERWRGAAQDVSDVAYILAGRRIGVGLLIGGRIHSGRHGAAGEIGVLAGSGWFAALERIQRGTATRGGAYTPEFIADFATGIAATVLTVDPDAVVIGGGLAHAKESLIEPLRAELDRLCLFPVRVEASTLADESVVMGAIRIALDDASTRLFSVTGRRPPLR
ncbi:ROK family protein [Nonomuraea sediminis]|uniref:ROK family protein n=1 Tax=Nonomuraea sediminis TaxID=2835864 RepID=UPI001BDD76E1|nr:ROK family protein [Nonomuraea sediminis]